ncbi:hypothetical protein SAMN05216370_3113 [Pseudomonas peli]|jgi:ribosomal protein L40E|uniref:DnrP protein n=1 Tax=Pseudomonas peli TaxID=592361 RepID=A0AB37ZE70_9PSED|nr:MULTISPECIES: DnrP protein [Pseudomonas]MCZ4323158.1 DnrP protein [Pseudomonas anguilliseptica]NMZ70683.1 DnrP protein [Pseudomonas peli]PJE40628.1 MAG: DnrP protein [Pseudomonas sp.] [Pseudomonas sp. FEMGT703P]SCW71931.1 hypothetical protein SAMN05216370_3113 [Pseudomonas peli]
MPNCLYCQRENPEKATDCQKCGMLLPAHNQRDKQQRERRFVWFCAALTIFCLTMAVWLPRTLF